MKIMKNKKLIQWLAMPLQYILALLKAYSKFINNLLRYFMCFMVKLPNLGLTQT
jgi:hypothetical protein